MHAVAILTAGLLMLRSAGRGDPAQRRSRLLFAASMGAAAASAVISVGYVLVLGKLPVPSFVDPVALLWVPLAACGLWLLPSGDDKPLPRHRLLADGAVSGSALLFASWLLVLKPIAADANWHGLAKVVQLGYPLTDVVIITMVFAVVPRVRGDQRVFLNAIAVGLLLIAVADSGTAFRFAQAGALSFGWPDAVLQAALVTLIYAAQVEGPGGRGARPVVTRTDHLVPFAGPALGMAVAVWYAVSGGQMGPSEIILGVLMMSAVVVRQIVFVREISIVAEGHRHAAGHDGLTGLPNRVAFIERLTHQLGEPTDGVAVVIIDLDGFKTINDSLGHDCGDRVLVDFGRSLSRAAPGHLVARLGGDEFALLVVADDPEAEAERIARSVTRLPMPGAGGLMLTCSAGISAVRPDDGPADVLRRADLAMFWVKRSPYMRMAIFDELMAERADRRSVLMAQLAGAADRGELRLVYQPVYRLANHDLAGAEALLRWRHPVLGEVPPDEFIPLAEENGQITEIGAWVLDTALAQVASWRREGRLLPQLLVNVSTAQFNEDLPEQVELALRRHGLPPQCLVLEITEGQVPGLMANSAVQQLRTRGVRVAMDDFGSGYSSLAQLARLPVDILKIDREFINNIDVLSGRHVLDAVVTLARALGLETVAEGIEDVEQAASAARCGIDYAQGYLYSRPIGPDELGACLPTPAVPATRSDQHDASLSVAAE